MTTGYIYRLRDVRPLLHGLMAHFTWWAMFQRVAHAHRCFGCQHVVACTCTSRGKHDLVRCLWCRPWTMRWRKAKRKPAKKWARRSLAAVP